MKFVIQLSAAFLALTAVLAAAFHPDFGVLWGNPLALLGMGLIGFGLYRNAQQGIHRHLQATQPVSPRRANSRKP